MTFPLHARLTAPQYARIKRVDEILAKAMGYALNKPFVSHFHGQCLDAWQMLETHVVNKRTMCGCFKPTAVTFTGSHETHIIECEFGARLLKEFQDAEALMNVEKALIEKE